MFTCDISIPNKEILYVYEKEVLSKIGKTNVAVEMQQAIFNKDLDKVQKILEKFMLESISYYDCANEGFYHGMMLGLCAIVSNRYRVKSNQESGDGRFDIELYPNDKNIPGFIFEFKKVDKINDLERAVTKALDQININHYESAMKSDGIKNIIKVGIAFCGKHAMLKSI